MSLRLVQHDPRSNHSTRYPCSALTRALVAAPTTPTRLARSISTYVFHDHHHTFAHQFLLLLPQYDPIDMAKAGKGGFYAVQKGKQPGVYKTWAECEAQTKGFAGGGV